jgi:hypothetical protein
MKKKLDIPKDFWKDFKDRKDFDEFFSELFKEGISQMLKAEMTDHLGYEKHSKEGNNSGNSRNGDYPKTLKTNLGEITVSVPRDRNGEFDPKVVPKHESRLSEEIAQVIIGLYQGHEHNRHPGTDRTDLRSPGRFYQCVEYYQRHARLDQGMAESPFGGGLLCGLDGRDIHQDPAQR